MCVQIEIEQRGRNAETSTTTSPSYPKREQKLHTSGVVAFIVYANKQTSVQQRQRPQQQNRLIKMFDIIPGMKKVYFSC